LASLGTGPDARVLGTMEITVLDPAKRGVYSYDAKERCEQIVRYSPLPRDSLREEIEGLALAAHRALECRDAARVDVRLDGKGRPNFLEINPLPGLHPTHSDLPMLAAQEGMRYEELIQCILDSAARRTQHTPR